MPGAGDGDAVRGEIVVAVELDRREVLCWSSCGAPSGRPVVVGLFFTTAGAEAQIWFEIVTFVMNEYSASPASRMQVVKHVAFSVEMSEVLPSR